MFSEVVKSGDVGLNTKLDISKDNVDIGKRLDINKVFDEKPGNKIDVSKRLPVSEIGEKKELSITEAIKKYLADLKDKSDFADTIPEDCIDPNKIEMRTPDEVKTLRDEFDDMKKALIKEWEENNDCEWPRYTEEEIKENNITERKPGDRYDAHHIQPLHAGGENTASNITPLDVKSHRDIHSGSGKNFVDSVKGGSVG